MKKNNMGSSIVTRACGWIWALGAVGLAVWALAEGAADEHLQLPATVRSLVVLAIILTFVVWINGRGQAEVIELRADVADLRAEIANLHVEVRDHFLKFRSPADLLALNDMNMARGHITDVYENNQD